MVGFPDGTLTGAPINFPKSAQRGECCPPVFLQNQNYGVPQDVASTDLTIEGLKICADTTFSLYRYSATTPATPLPTILGTSCDENAPPNLDNVVFQLDTRGARGAFAVKVTNECGCCELVPVSVLAPPP